jgi:hypothetical protein
VVDRGTEHVPIAGLWAYLDGADLLEPMRSIAIDFHVPPNSILTMNRRRPFSTARFAFWWHLHEECGWSLPAIGKRWGCDHKSVLYGVRFHARTTSTITVNDRNNGAP